MDSTATVTGRGGSLPMSQSQTPRKEWRAVPIAVTEDPDSSKFVSDERTIYEVQHGTSPVDANFCSITVDGTPNNDLLQQRLVSISRQRKELQQVEVELRSQVLARAEISEMQKNYAEQIKEHSNAAASLKVQLQEREQCIHELEKKMDEKDRELRAIKIDNEAAWAKEDLLREQNKELATFRRELDNSEAERAQHLKQIRELKELIHEKENQFLELEEQHKVAQESLLYKDEQLREAQAWVARVQEMDALQSTTNHSLQAELHDRTEQLNHLWLGCQRQFAEMERLHVQAVQQLQLELAEARVRNGTLGDPESDCANSKDASASKGNQFNVNGSVNLNGNSEFMLSGSIANGQPLASVGNASTKADHVSGVPVIPSSVLGMRAYLPPGQMTALHPFMLHQQGIQQSLPLANSHIPTPHIAHFPAIAPSSPLQHQQWPSPQVVQVDSKINQHQYHGQSECTLLRSDGNYKYELPANETIHSSYLDSHLSPPQRTGPVITSSPDSLQITRVSEPSNHQLSSSHNLQKQLQDGSSQFPSMISEEMLEQKLDMKVGVESNTVNSADISDGLESTNRFFHQRDVKSGIEMINKPEQDLDFSIKQSLPEANDSGGADNQRITTSAIHTEHTSELPRPAGLPTSTMLPGKVSQPSLLDERSLLACIVRAIPAGAGGQIRISTTLPNRLGKMLAPLHWHDYRKHYGKLDEFVACHPELFVIEGDFIHLREGAQEIISATTAAAKVAAAAAAVSQFNNSDVLPSIALTPVAQPYRLKRVSPVSNRADGSGKPVQEQQPNGLCYNVIQDHLKSVKILSKSNNSELSSGLPADHRSNNSSVDVTLGNGPNNGKTGVSLMPNNGLKNGPHGLNSGGKQQERIAGSRITSRTY